MYYYLGAFFDLMCQFAVLLDNLHNGMMVVVEGIFEDKASRHFWQLLKEDSKVTITYDLYYAGIAVLDNKRYKQHYIINF